MDESDASPSWVSIKGFYEAGGARVAADTLSALEIPNEVSDEVVHGNGYQLRVPPARAAEARRALAEPAVPEDELTQLALQEPPPDDFEPAAGRADSQARRLALMVAAAWGVLLLLSGTVFVLSVTDLRQRGLANCTPLGCRSMIPLVLMSALMSLISMIAFLGTVAGTRGERAP